ncbi:MAG: PTS sugar transporter subunit IIA [Chloroflexi bacterium]|nr:PTS sugar transporter subunit IIA [Chloroflexota bacterium]
MRAKNSGKHSYTAKAGVTIDADLVITHLRVTNYTEAISALAERLSQHGYVTAGFLEAVLKREASQPTGLPLPDIPVAIPHAEAEYCKVPAIAVGILDQPVQFGEMGGDSGSTLPVQIVFLLALNNPDQQVEWLQRLVLLFQQPGLLQHLKQLSQEDAVAAFLREHLLPKRPEEQQKPGGA